MSTTCARWRPDTCGTTTQPAPPGLGQLAPAQAHTRPLQINLADYRIRRNKFLGGLTSEYHIAA
jgi:hypothetical protein